MNKEQFVSAIETLKEVNQFVIKAYDLGIDIIQSPVMKLMDKMVDIIDNGSQEVPYWCFELDYGRNYTPGCVTDENGKDVDISTPQKLYEQVYKTQE